MLIQLVEEVSRSVVQSPAEVGLEATLGNLVLWVKLFAEIVGAVLIGIGIALGLARFLGISRSPSQQSYEKTRLLLARFLSLGLEFQLAADILGTTVAPSWTQIGKLGAIAVIRTGLNYFLAREMKEEQEAVESAPPPREAKLELSQTAR
jgi:uncharacterized membrane protein